MNPETQLRDRIVAVGRSLYDRGLSPGSSGNISVRLSDGWLLTPTNSCLGALDAATLSKMSWDGKLLAGHPPSKEAFLHLAVYENRPEAGAIIHLHATYSAAVSCLAGLNPCSCIRPLTAYFVMRVGQLPLIPYCRPGDQTLAKKVGHLATKHGSVLLANHGPVVSAKDLENAMYAVEELEETAKLTLLLEGKSVNILNESQIAELKHAFGAQWEN